MRFSIVLCHRIKINLFLEITIKDMLPSSMPKRQPLSCSIKLVVSLLATEFHWQGTEIDPGICKPSDNFLTGSSETSGQISHKY